MAKRIREGKPLIVTVTYADSGRHAQTLRVSGSAAPQFWHQMEELHSQGGNDWQMEMGQNSKVLRTTGQLLRSERIARRLSQKELGKAVGMAASNISELERGKRSVSKKVARRLADVFDADYRMFLLLL